MRHRDIRICLVFFCGCNCYIRSDIAADVGAVDGQRDTCVDCDSAACDGYGHGLCIRGPFILHVDLGTHVLYHRIAADNCFCRSFEICHRIGSVDSDGSACQGNVCGQYFAVFHTGGHVDRCCLQDISRQLSRYIGMSHKDRARNSHSRCAACGHDGNEPDR